MGFFSARLRNPQSRTCGNAGKGHDALRCVRLIAASGALVWIVAMASAALASPREWQPLLLRGYQIPQLLGTTVSRLEVLAVHGGKLVPIPFQVDEVLPGRVFALPYGPMPTAGPPVHILGLNDEMAMMMFDLGERAADSTQLPKDALEVTVADPLGGRERYAYIAAVRNPSRSMVRYVHYDPQLESIQTDHYELSFKRELPDDFRLRNQSGGISGNLISGFELRGKVTVLNMLQFHLAESDIDSRLLAYSVGPVRVIRRLGHRFRVFLGIHSPEVSTMEFFYRDFAQAPFTMRLPLHKLFRDIQGRIAMDFLDLRGYSLLASGLDDPIEISAHTAALVGNATPTQWLALRGDGRLMLQTFAPDAELSLIDRTLYYQAGPARGNSQSALPAAVGIQTDGWQRLPGGSHRFDPLLISVPESYGIDHAVAESFIMPVVTVRALTERYLAPPSARLGSTVAPSQLGEDPR
jgi:hypothetical protein